MNTIEKIKELKKQRNAVILAHYYTIGEVQDVADFVGDSLALSEKAAKTDADVILFAGVNFMAETAKILSPQKIVLYVDPNAGCSLADSCPSDDFEAFVAKYPDHLVVSYVNTTAKVKALTDIVVTSSNAVQIIESLPKDQKILFGPDKNLGNYIASKTGREMVIWQGACHVHSQFSLQAILDLKAQNPKAKVLAHPECPQPILIVADYVGSTAELLRVSSKDSANTFIVATESGIIHQMRKLSPDKKFIPVPSDCGCNDCEFMKLNSIAKIEHALQTLQPQVVMSEELRVKAEKPILEMLERSRKLGLI